MSGEFAVSFRVTDSVEAGADPPPFGIIRANPLRWPTSCLLHLHGLSTGDFRVLPALLGLEAAGLAPSTITRLTKSWTAEYQAFSLRRVPSSDRGLSSPARGGQSHGERA
jgi:hypothetical protein